MDKYVDMYKKFNLSENKALLLKNLSQRNLTPKTEVKTITIKISEGRVIDKSEEVN